MPVSGINNLRIEMKTRFVAEQNGVKNNLTINYCK